MPPDSGIPIPHNHPSRHTGAGRRPSPSHAWGSGKTDKSARGSDIPHPCLPASGVGVGGAGVGTCPSPSSARSEAAFRKRACPAAKTIPCTVAWSRRRILRLPRKIRPQAGSKSLVVMVLFSANGPFHTVVTINSYVASSFDLETEVTFPRKTAVDSCQFLGW